MKIEISKRERVYDGFYKMDRITLRHELFAGGWSNEIVRDLMVRPDAVCVLLFDPVRQTVILVEQFRIAGLNEPNAWMMELVAGLIDKDETPEQVAQREALEEAGVDIRRLEKITEYMPSPGGSDEMVHLYIGEVDTTGVGGIHGLDHEDEDIRVHVVPVDDAWQMAEQGRLNNAATFMAMQWLKLNREDLTQRWTEE